MGNITYFGAAPDTGNLGVSALCFSVIDGLLPRTRATITVFDHSRGAGPLDGWQSRVGRTGGMRSKRWYRPESHAWIGAALASGIPLGASASILSRAAAVLDISGGDSFTDLYGPERFKAIVWCKQAALRMGTPLLLLPQTYGPFNDPAARAEASRLARGAAAAWARDARSYEILRELLGDSFDPARHRLGVDVAFLLEAHRAPDFVDEPRDGAPLAAINVSGLIHNDPEKARSRYRFVADYREVKRRLVERLAQAGARVLLVPHVVTPRGHYESDTAAAEALTASLPAALRSRVTVAPEYADPRHVKWVIARADWFCGTRMHATIAGLSSGVPTAAVAYSDKTLGVFESCGQGDQVVDPRLHGTDEVVERVWASFESRSRIRASLEAGLPAVLGQASRQMDEIAAVVNGAIAPEASAAR